MKLFLDANAIIYGHEADDSLRQVVLQRLMHWCRDLGGSLATSRLSRLECRVVPLRNGNQAWLAQYEKFFRSEVVEVVPVSAEVIEQATLLRVKYRFKSPDAIQLASALLAGAHLFLTGDAALKKCVEIPVELIAYP